MIQILVLSSDQTLLNQIPYAGNRQEAEWWAESYREQLTAIGGNTDFSFRFIEE